jgi:transketolase
VVRNVNGHDPNEVRIAIETARAQTVQPTLICCKTVSGFGAPNRQGTAKAHGAALGEAEPGDLVCRIGRSPTRA